MGQVNVRHREKKVKILGRRGGQERAIGGRGGDETRREKNLIIQEAFHFQPAGKWGVGV
jgi:hypothetical protein